MSHARSAFDDLYFELFGHYCAKEGQAFERLVAAVAQITFPNAEVAHDQRLRGQISDSLYQIDVLQVENSQQSFGEAKDYTVQKKKVGRGDVQKLAGALGDVTAEKGAMYSATDYTKPAKQYAKGAKQIIKKEIALYHVRPAIEKDSDGRIRTVVINIHIELPDHANSVFNAIWTPSAQVLLIEMLGIDSPPVRLEVDVLYDSEGQRLSTISELTSGAFNNGSELSQGCLVLRKHFVKHRDQLLELLGFEYRVPFLIKTCVLEISGGKPRILVKTDDGSVDRLVTDRELKSISFSDDGKVVRKKAVR